MRLLVGPRLKLCREEEHERARAESLAKKAGGGVPSATSSGTTTPTSTTSAGVPVKQRKKALNPIIIISPSSTALISMYNVRRLLEESVYVPPSASLHSRRARADLAPPASFVHPEEARAQATSGAEDMLQISHARTTSTISSSLQGGQQEARKARYFVVDGVEALAKFGPDAW